MPWTRSSLSPALRSALACMSTHQLQPLIWLARRDRNSRSSGTRARLAALLRPCAASRAPSRRRTGFCMRGRRGVEVDMVGLLLVTSRGLRRSHPHDRRREENVTAMDEKDLLAERFEAHRTRLHAVARRMLGSTAEADDALQEAWTRTSRAGRDDVDDLGAWLTTVVSRVCLNMLDSRKRRREESLAGAEERLPDPAVVLVEPEEQALVADAVGAALLVVLDQLSPPERLA